ncbi:transposase [Streptomyces sp. NPDC001135]
MVRRHELTDQEWELLAPLIPRSATGRPRVEDRQVVNGMVYKLRTGISWRDLPERYGPWKTVYTRFRRYALDGVFTQALQQVQAQADAAQCPVVEEPFHLPQCSGIRGRDENDQRGGLDQPDDRLLPIVVGQNDPPGTDQHITLSASPHQRQVVRQCRVQQGLQILMHGKPELSRRVEAGWLMRRSVESKGRR